MDSYYNRKEREISSPSFSSSLLDAIYRSIDEGNENRALSKETMRKKKNTSSSRNENEFSNDFRRAHLVEKWMEKGDIGRKSSRNDALFLNSSSSDSSSGYGFSSSEAESSRFGAPKAMKAKNLVKELNFFTDQIERRVQEGKFVKTKSKALKIYGELKKVKQPISPGKKVASFLNSIFAAGNEKKKKKNISSNVSFYNGIESKRDSKSGSSYSRSCLSKNPSLINGKSSKNCQRSVRFSIDEHCGEKNLYMETNFVEMEKYGPVEEATRDLLRSYKKWVDRDYDWRELRIKHERLDRVHDEEIGEEEDDDAASYASSDLFELDNIISVGNGMDRYSHELPVYETTHFHSHAPMVSGLIL